MKTKVLNKPESSRQEGSGSRQNGFPDPGDSSSLLAMQILDGKLVSAARRDALKLRSQAFFNKAGRKPCLAVVLVGEHGPSQVYVRNKVKACQDVGIESQHVGLSESATEAEFLQTLQSLHQDPKVDGILVQLPVPKHLQHLDLGKLVKAEKDADGFNYENLGKAAAGVPATVLPCTPMGVMSILQHYKIDVAGMNAVVVGRSLIVGRPMSWLLTQAQATVTVCHSKTKNLRAETLKADLVVVAAGQREFLGREDFKKDAIVVDVGIHGSGAGGMIAGDVRFKELEGWVKAAIPVPGGVGPMTITSLLENTMSLAEARRK